MTYPLLIVTTHMLILIISPTVRVFSQEDNLEPAWSYSWNEAVFLQFGVDQSPVHLVLVHRSCGHDLSMHLTCQPSPVLSLQRQL